MTKQETWRQHIVTCALYVKKVLTTERVGGQVAKQISVAANQQ